MEFWKTGEKLAWDGPPPRDADLRLRWLGQAGFLIETISSRVLIDPYLSDSLAEKYRGKPYPHRRMMETPIAPSLLGGIDLYLATHGHTDHLDPGTLGPVAASSPDCIFVVPASCLDLALERGAPADRLVGANAFESLKFKDVAIHPLPSAHEELSTDEAGRHRFLGYVLELGGLVLYHSGDCVPYPGLSENLAPYDIDLGLLPVNGRDQGRREAGIPGNFDLGEAVGLAFSRGFGLCIGHHFGMFDFNTIDVAEANTWLASEGPPDFILAEVGAVYHFKR
jgi:L-ascorbate metabolism protein UlaG (beta-lactamase superfamily)